MNETTTKNGLYNGPKVRISEEDNVFIHNVAREKGISQQQAIRLMFFLARNNFDKLQEKNVIFIIK